MSKVITPHFEKLIDRFVASGRFNNKSEVIRAGLRLLEEHEANAAAANGDERHFRLFHRAGRRVSRSDRILYLGSRSSRCRSMLPRTGPGSSAKASPETHWRHADPLEGLRGFSTRSIVRALQNTIYTRFHGIKLLPWNGKR